MPIKHQLTVTDINGSLRECLNITHDMTYPGYVRVEFASNRTAPATYFEWYPVDDFIQNNPNLIHIVKKSKQPAHDDLGVVSHATVTTIIDKTKKWKPGIYKGFPVWISRGTGEGQVRNVIENTHNSLTVDKKFDLKPDKTSQYVLSHNIHNATVMNNTVPGNEN
ncbi:hypothetical protein A3D80_03005 [Candidatus Roizmanbacteria bacterium RIFCSPHIGHO2_02_FULL_40_13b]|nr:MAG: hypothetical protein A3D80_03005 [Candidatus Roizmanbacteria bacterium RIFCSPHIGHO2_02_FULL_40_13b]OGK49449.1 MAG: hypothetical protein A3A56_00140 [Candidatus Roizmanbacteria bacterium RIFCSPLOWO2_01_FULL_40_32]OGK57362.1 MAG: hypothetical protein A3H83_00805 [Candidatus Roizmanbacteria bacterium RIFCSPLOWO2_02_FULL_39_8]